MSSCGLQVMMSPARRSQLSRNNPWDWNIYLYTRCLDGWFVHICLYGQYKYRVHGLRNF